MGEYISGQETKKLILDTCRELFYEKGYSRTTTRDIAKNAHINLSAISYHFTSKSNIRDIIMKTSLDRLVDKTINYTQDYGLRYILGTYALWYKVYEDEKFRRFYCEFAISKEIIYEELKTIDFVVYLYKIFNVKCEKPSKLARKYELQAATALQSERVCAEYAKNNRTKYSYYEMAEMNLRLQATLFGIPETEINGRFREARRILKTIDMSRFLTTLLEDAQVEQE